MHRVVVPLALSALFLCGCEAKPPKAASASAVRLLAAAAADDRVAFEAEIDRHAVREDVRRQVTEMARGKALDVEGGPSDFALDRMIGPSAISLVDHAGRTITTPPQPAQIESLMRVIDKRHVCLRDAASSARCLLTFSKDRNGWRLVGMQAMNVRIEVDEAGA
jgi:hypothetical protein